jgi:predicted transposase YdaD
MLTTEWDWDTAREVWHEEGREERGEEIARNALEKGIPIETVQEITGLSLDTIERLRG